MAASRQNMNDYAPKGQHVQLHLGGAMISL